MIELTPEQLQALDAANGTPPVLVDQRTHETYVLLKSGVYESIKPNLPPSLPETFEIPEGIQQAWATLRHELPALLANRKTRGRWVCYRKHERIAIGNDYFKLQDECVRRGFDDGEFLIVKIEPGAADEIEIDRTFVEFDDD